jgi:hypothetical protein
VKNMKPSYHVFGKTEGIEPSVLPAIPPQAASAEPGDSRETVESIRL